MELKLVLIWCVVMISDDLSQFPLVIQSNRFTKPLEVKYWWLMLIYDISIIYIYIVYVTQHDLVNYA